jgi:hypothetical protein
MPPCPASLPPPVSLLELQLAARATAAVVAATISARRMLFLVRMTIMRNREGGTRNGEGLETAPPPQPPGLEPDPSVDVDPRGRRRIPNGRRG